MHRNVPTTSRSTQATTCRRDLVRNVMCWLAVVSIPAEVACSKPRDADSGAKTAEPASRPPGSTPAPSAEGDSSGRVTLSDAASRTAWIVVDTVRAMASTASTGGLTVPAQIELDPARVNTKERDRPDRQREAIEHPRKSIEYVTDMDGADVWK